MAATAQKRLLTEYKNLTNDSPEGIVAGPRNEDDMFNWDCLIQGPDGTPFEGGIFPATLTFPKDYPLAPPTMKFECDMWHPNGTYLKFFLIMGVGRVANPKMFSSLSDRGSMYLDFTPSR